jgi:hypothetical protein
VGVIVSGGNIDADLLSQFLQNQAEKQEGA